MFQPDKCDLCGECLEKCQWMEADHQQAVAWMTEMMQGRRAPALDQCITCYACNEICPRSANPFDLIAELQERYQTLASLDEATKYEARFSFDKEIKDAPRADRIMSLCVFAKTDARLIQGELYNLPRVSGKPYFCWVMMSHMGAESIQKKHAQQMVDRLSMTGAKEVVCFHDDCYAMLKKLAPGYGIEVPFKPVHLAEYLVEYLAERRQSLKPVGLKLAYQRPCASRHTPEKEIFIDQLFQLAGAERVPREYDRENALCCAGIKMMLGKGDPAKDQEKNIGDARQAGAKAMVCLCPMCMQSLSKTAGDMDMPLIFIGDLARMALGEIAAPGCK